MKTKSATYDVIVIGGGASGMIAAAIAAEQGASVLLVEKNDVLGKKLSITGGGRCNITNAEEDTRTLLANYGKSNKFLFSAFSRFGMQDTVDYFAKLGLPIKIEDRKRAFPVSESAQDVVDALEKELTKRNVKVLLGSTVEFVYAPGGHVQYVQVNGARFHAKNYILATGGTSRPETGSTGDGFKWLRSTGHTIHIPTPNVTPLVVNETWVRDAAGLVAKSSTATFFLDGKRSFGVKGDILFTHFGLSGPVILNSAHKVAELLEQGSVAVSIDCYPSKNHKELDTFILEVLKEHKTKQLKNTLRYIAPEGLVRVFAMLLKDQVNLDITCSELIKVSRNETPTSFRSGYLRLQPSLRLACPES